DTVARLGGDEFAALICGDVEQNQLVEIAERLLEQLRRPYRVSGAEVTVAASIGVAFASAGTTPGELLRNADLAMYRAKSKGKNRVEVYAPQMRADVLRRTVLDRRLRAALRDGEFALLHQPVVELGKSGGPPRIVALEASVRWRSARGALLTPAEFLRSPETGERAAELGAWAAARAIEEASRRGLEASVKLPVTVRLAADALRRADFAERVGSALDATGLPPGRLVLELVGSGSPADLVAITGAVEALHRAGVGIGLGGLWAGPSAGGAAGTAGGAAGLEALYRWPLSQLRLDAGLVRRVADPALGGREAARLPTLTAAVLQLAHGLGLLVVADGVTRPEQAAALREFGCDRAQGLLFGAPQTEDELRTAVAQASRVPAPRAALLPPLRPGTPPAHR
ncbi:bifunctional diguanylate cyclase/phosphodiesterase, partial [Mangrovactinospora gilvigrisea]|uniref:bifunctional diguanylate cyclase/phosphodiesterase n=1 Tax=Mangrovactinospora gilvigrisea TaxID=1428644 RepID=UPI001114A18C